MEDLDSLWNGERAYVSIEGGGGGGGGSGREVSHSSEKEENDEFAVVDDELIIMSDSNEWSVVSTSLIPASSLSPALRYITIILSSLFE